MQLWRVGAELSALSSSRRHGADGRIKPMKKWEYATAPVLVHATQQILNTWGEDGWELVTIIPGPNPENLVAYFKRELV
ncbi:DUF4177 domain-containing protein [Corynebacterium propinquum]